MDRRRWFSQVDLNIVSHGNVPRGPWPRVCDKQYVRYCFKDDHSVTHLSEMVTLATLVWAPAFEMSGLRITPDLGCYTPGPPEVWYYRCICRPWPNEARQNQVIPTPMPS